MNHIRKKVPWKEMPGSWDYFLECKIVPCKLCIDDGDKPENAQKIRFIKERYPDYPWPLTAEKGIVHVVHLKEKNKVVKGPNPEVLKDLKTSEPPKPEPPKEEVKVEPPKTPVTPDMSVPKPADEALKEMQKLQQQKERELAALLPFVLGPRKEGDNDTWLAQLDSVGFMRWILNTIPSPPDPQQTETFIRYFELHKDKLMRSRDRLRFELKEFFDEYVAKKVDEAINTFNKFLKQENRFDPQQAPAPARNATLDELYDKATIHIPPQQSKEEITDTLKEVAKLLLRLLEKI